MFCYRRVRDNNGFRDGPDISRCGCCSVLWFEEAQAQSVAHNKDGTEAHGEGGDHRIHLQTESGIVASGRNRYADNIIEESPEEVFFDIADGCFAQFNSACNIQQIVFHQNNIGRFHRHICSGANGNSYICSGKGRSVVDAIADHGSLFAALLEAADFLFLILREDFSDDTIHTDLAADSLSGLFVISGEHDDFNPHILQFFNGLTTCRFYYVCHGDDADQFSGSRKV